MNIAAGDFAELWVHRENVRVLDEEFTTGRKLAGNTLSRARGTLCRSWRAVRQRHRPQRSRCAEKITPAHFACHAITPPLAISKLATRANEI